MNKYENALDIVARHISRTKTNTSPYIHGEVEKQLSVIDELVRKTKLYAWHDLRKNPTDLPQYDTDILCTNQHGEYLEGKGYHLDYDEHEEVFEMETNECLMYKVIAWKQTEPFEGEENDRTRD